MAGAVVNFRVGSQLLKTIDAAADASRLSRQTWLLLAVDQYLQDKKAKATKITAAGFLVDRQLVRIRIDNHTLTKIDKSCEKAGFNRTVWLLDACLSQIASEIENNGNSDLQGKDKNLSRAIRAYKRQADKLAGC